MKKEEYNASQSWDQTWLNRSMAFPSEYVIRILKGAYPRLNLDKEKFKGQRFLDIGFGDGRNLVLAHQCGFDIYGVEITPHIVEHAKHHLQAVCNRPVDVRVGNNTQVPFDDNYFDVLLSWNVSYYMGEVQDYQHHVKEYARVLKPGGLLIFSIPKKTAFIYKGSETVREGYQIIREDPFQARNGAVLRMFQDEQEIEQTFSDYFDQFVFGSIHDDCFGYEYHWHIGVCYRNSASVTG